MTTSEWFSNLTPEEAVAYKQGLADARGEARRLGRRLIAYELILGRISRNYYPDPANAATQCLANHSHTRDAA